MLIAGNSNSTVLDGTAQADTIYGHGGNDTLNGGAGSDILIGDNIFSSPIVRLTNGQATHPMFSPDGTQIAYVTGVLGGQGTLNLLNLITGKLTQLSVPVVGQQFSGPTADSFPFSFSPDGTKIAFKSNNQQLLANDTNIYEDIYVVDVATGVLTLVSAKASGVSGNGLSEDPQFSPDGTKVLFQSTSNDLVANDTNGRTDIFMKDLTTGAVTRVSVSTLGFEGTAGIEGSQNPVYSRDGTAIAFDSDMSMLTGDAPNNNHHQIYVRTLPGGSFTGGNLNYMSQWTAGGTFVQGNLDSIQPDFSPGNNQIVFASNSTNFPGGNSPGKYQIYIKDQITGTLAAQTQLVAPDGTVIGMGNGDSFNPSFSPDGHFIVFTSNANNLVPGDTNGVTDIFLHSPTTGETIRLSQSAAGEQGNLKSGSFEVTQLFRGPAMFSPGGGMVAFSSEANNLVPGDSGTSRDIFAVTLGLSPFNLQGVTAPGNDALNGGDGNDTLLGGLGNDGLDGGSGIDSAAFSGLRSAYTVTPLATGVMVSGPDGTDTLTSIERLMFSDVVATKQDADFSGDFQGDLLWRHNDGTLFAWLMNNGQRATDVDLSKIPTQWHIEDTGDFNGDGTGDLVWRNDDGTTYLWLMKNGARNADVDLHVIPNSFHIRGTGDFDGDGDSDILWQHNDGTTLAWLMQNGQRTTDVSYGNIPTSFHVQGMGDFDGDGDTDILWRNNSGSTLAWLMQAGQRVQDVDYGAIPTSYHVQATGDFDGDGDTDILWRHNDGTTLSWLMQNGQRVQDVSYGQIPNTFHVRTIGNINGDGTSDIVWQHNDGTTLAWLMVKGQRAADVTLGTIPTVWSIQDHHFDIV